jgi:hypothetical protein
MEATRHFYEDLIGMPLTATWCEADELFGKERVYCHCFFGLADGSALAFFQFANPEDQALVEDCLKKAGFKEPGFFVLDHGYCRSIYVTDPNGMILELTTGNPEAAEGDKKRRATAHAGLKRWLTGDRHSNNTFRELTHHHA